MSTVEVALDGWALDTTVSCYLVVRHQGYDGKAALEETNRKFR